MKTKILFLGLMLLGLFSFSSCGDDDKDGGGNDSLVGTWKAVDGSDILFFQFFASGDYVAATFEVGSEDVADLTIGSYTTSGSTIFTKIANESENAQFTVSATQLTIKKNDVTETFTKVENSEMAQFVETFTTIDRSKVAGAWMIDEGVYMYMKSDGSYYKIDSGQVTKTGKWSLYKNAFVVTYEEDGETEHDCNFIVSADGSTLVLKYGTTNVTTTKVETSVVEQYLAD